MYGGKAQLVLNHVFQLLVMHHEPLLVVELVGQVEEEACAEGRLGGLLCCLGRVE